MGVHQLDYIELFNGDKSYDSVSKLAEKLFGAVGTDYLPVGSEVISFKGQKIDTSSHAAGGIEFMISMEVHQVLENGKLSQAYASRANDGIKIYFGPGRKEVYAQTSEKNIGKGQDPMCPMAVSSSNKKPTIQSDFDQIKHAFTALLENYASVNLDNAFVVLNGSDNKEPPEDPPEDELFEYADFTRELFRETAQNYELKEFVKP